MDYTFMKEKYYGTLFVVVCLDGNNQIYPLEFGVENSKNDASWSYFFTKLNEAIGDVEDLVIIFNRHKTIEKIISTVMSYVVHGICCHHLKQNVAKKFKGEIKSTYWLTAKSYQVFAFNEYMR